MTAPRSGADGDRRTNAARLGSRTERTAEYLDIVDRTGVAGYGRTPANLGAQLLTPDLGAGRTEIITFSWWPDIDHIRARRTAALATANRVAGAAATAW